MAITRRTGPADGPAVVDRAVRQIMRNEFEAFGAEAAGADAVASTQPIQRFRLNLGDLAGPDALVKAAPVGWSYLVVGAGPEPAAIADVGDAAAGAAPSFGSLIRGRMAKRLAAAAQLAASRYGEGNDHFEARILEIPAVYMTALWLHGARDIFIPFLEGATKDGDPVTEDSSFLSRAQDAAKKK
jgi:hypothetical protein